MVDVLKKEALSLGLFKTMSDKSFKPPLPGRPNSRSSVKSVTPSFTLSGFGSPSLSRAANASLASNLSSTSTSTPTPVVSKAQCKAAPSVSTGVLIDLDESCTLASDASDSSKTQQALSGLVDLISLSDTGYEGSLNSSTKNIQNSNATPVGKLSLDRFQAFNKE